MKIIQQTREDLRFYKQWPSRLKAKKKAVVAVVGSPAGSAHERSPVSTLNVYDRADAENYFLCHSHVTVLTEIAFLFFFP